MKIKVSISIDEETLKAIEERVDAKETLFRNNSHFIEHATQKLLKEVNVNGD
jgi:Arc/MetJ-type ribon-helix-helix transcriptional regulator